MINLAETGVFPLGTLGLYSKALLNNIFPQGEWVIRLGQRSHNGQRWQRSIDAECNGFILIPVWINNHMPSKVWDEITYPFPKL